MICSLELHTCKIGAMVSAHRDSFHLAFRIQLQHYPLILIYIGTTTDRSVMENLMKDISEMSLLYIDEEVIQVFEEIGQGKHTALHTIINFTICMSNV